MDEFGEPARLLSWLRRKLRGLSVGTGRIAVAIRMQTPIGAQSLQAVRSGLLDRAIGQAGQARGLGEVGALTRGQGADAALLDGRASQRTCSSSASIAPRPLAVSILPVALDGSRVVPPRSR